MIEILNLWETPIVKDYRIFSNHQEILELAEHCTTNERSDGVFTPGIKFIDDPKINLLKSWILETANKSVSEINKEFWEESYSAKFLDMWSWSSKDYSNPVHSHPNTSWAGIYCLDSGEDNGRVRNGSTVFYNPVNWGTFLDPGVAFLDRRAYQINNLQAGDLLLFPGFLKHSAEYLGNIPRTIIAFNLVFV